MTIETQSALEKLLKQVRACTYCAQHLPLEPQPILRAHAESQILIVGQAPGIRVHNTGIPWNDPSGNRLRTWLNIGRDVFYDEKKISIIPIGYCYPGTGKSGDLPPRKECSEIWLPSLLKYLNNIKLTLLIGDYAQRHYLTNKRKNNLTNTVKAWNEYLPQYFPLPHPSPRNNIWLKKNPWFEQQLIPQLRERVSDIMVK